MIQIGSGLPPVADEPLAHLVACHDRILQRLQTLERVGENLETQPAAALDALANALRFLETSGTLHTRDEEESVFPRLREHLSEDERAYLNSLESEHRETEEVYAELLQLASDLRRQITPECAERYRRLASKLCGLYREHIESENTMLVAIGRRCLPCSELNAIRDEMKARRKSAPR
jgi:hemerythrin-like domain-containing protein